jgi:hypothetical protein
MNIRKMLYVVMIVVFALTLAACGGSKDDDKGSDAGDVKLSQSVEMTSELLGVTATVKYPDKWFAQSSPEGGVIVVGSDEAAVGSFLTGDSPDTIPDNSVFVMMMFLPGEMASAMGLAADAKLTDALNAMVENMGSSETELSKPTEITVNGVKMAQVEIKDKDADGLALMSKVGDTYVFATCVTNPGKVDDRRGECTAVAASVEVK